MKLHRHATLKLVRPDGKVEYKLSYVGGEAARQKVIDFWVLLYGDLGRFILEEIVHKEWEMRGRKRKERVEQVVREKSKWKKGVMVDVKRKPNRSTGRRRTEGGNVW